MTSTIDTHVRQSPTLARVDFDQELVTTIAASFMIRPSGFTLTPIEFEYLGDDDVADIPTGYAVGGILPSVVDSDLVKNLQNGLVRGFVRNYRALTSILTEDVYIGGWQDQNGLQCLDAVLIVRQFDRALRLSKAWNQKAMGQMKLGKYVRTIEV